MLPREKESEFSIERGGGRERERESPPLGILAGVTEDIRAWFSGSTTAHNNIPPAPGLFSPLRE